MPAVFVQWISSCWLLLEVQPTPHSYTLGYSIIWSISHFCFLLLKWGEKVVYIHTSLYVTWYTPPHVRWLGGGYERGAWRWAESVWTIQGSMEGRHQDWLWGRAYSCGHHLWGHLGAKQEKWTWCQKNDFRSRWRAGGCGQYEMSPTTSQYKNCIFFNYFDCPRWLVLLSFCCSFGRLGSCIQTLREWLP